MNYLAHAFLSNESPEAIAGALLGDFVKGAAAARYGAAVRDAIHLHRAIDRYTDAHATVHASRALVSPARRRFAGVMVDVFYDHFLARHWARYSHQPLAEFTAGVYAVLRAWQPQFPERLARMVPRMCGDDWLGAYAEVAAVDAALNGIARRLARYPRAQALHDAVEDLEREYPALERQFLDYFPQLCTFAAAQQPPRRAAG
jgi:acyl carrier protein phosphodiesterase